MQKTLKNFFLGGTSRKLKEGSSSCSDTDDSCFTNDTGVDFLLDGHEMNHHEFGDQPDRLDAKDSTKRKLFSENIGITNAPSSCRNIDKVCERISCI